MSTGLLQKDAEQLVPVVLARAAYEKRRIQEGTGGQPHRVSWFVFLVTVWLFAVVYVDEDAVEILIKVLENGIAAVRQGEIVFVCNLIFWNWL